MIYARAAEAHRLIDGWMKMMVGKIRADLVIGDMQSINEMAKLGTGAGIVAP